ncbi:MAG: hypothetical protein ACFFCT_07165 [Candidatus Odinarchaeota archaeon]
MREKILLTIVLLGIFLLPMGVYAHDIDVNLGYGQFYTVHRNASSGWRIVGTFSAEITIEFAICDSGNYSRWLNNQTSLLYEHIEATSHSLNFTVPYDDDWYVIFSNTNSAATINLHAEIYYIDQTGTTQTQITTYVQSSIVTPFFVGILVGITGICLLGIWSSRRKDRQPAVRYEELLSVPE